MNTKDSKEFSEKEAVRKEAKELRLERRHPALVILRALLQGNPLLVDKEEWYLQDGIFGPKRVMEDSKTGEKREIILGVDMTLAGFVAWCEKLPEETVLQTVFNSVMHMSRKERP